MLYRSVFARTAWIHKLAHYAVEKISVRFGDDVYDTHISDWYETYHQIYGK